MIAQEEFFGEDSSRYLLILNMNQKNTFGLPEDLQIQSFAISVKSENAFERGINITNDYYLQRSSHHRESLHKEKDDTYREYNYTICKHRKQRDTELIEILEVMISE